MPDDLAHMPQPSPKRAAQPKTREPAAQGADRSAATHAEGHQLGKRRPHRRPRHLGLFGLVLLILAIGAAAWGITSRNQTESALAKWTDAQAVPTVAIIHPARETATRKLVLPGNVEAFYEAPIYARVSGYLDRWFKDIGARVHRGDVLATIDTPDLDQQLAQAQADLATAQARQNFADLTAKRWKALLRTNAVSQQSADEKEGDALARGAEVNAARANLDRLRALESFKRLTAPFDGVVTARNTDIGALISAGSGMAVPLFKVADTHEMRVYVRVPQAYAAELVPGLKATLVQPQYPSVTFPATLATTSDSVAQESRTVLAELLAPNKDGRLWAGTYADVTFTLPGDRNMLNVPASALVFRAHGAELATVSGDRVAMKPVTIGRNLGSTIEIESGVTPDDNVIASPLDTLEEGETVSVVRPGEQQIAGE